jgi:hypothetical protein
MAGFSVSAPQAVACEYTQSLIACAMQRNAEVKAIADKHPERAIWRSGPSPERIREIRDVEYPQIGNWAYRLMSDGSYERWQFVGLWSEADRPAILKAS